MKKHNFLNLKIGSIEQYSMVVKKTDLNYWQDLGWLEYTEIGLPEEDEEAYMLYGEIKKNETLVFNRPTLLRNVSIDKLAGLEVIGVSTHLGTYGMGGAGFFGLLLTNSNFLTYAVWGAGSYVIIDNRVVEYGPNLYGKVKPWLSDFGGNETWDDLTLYISGSVIESFLLTADTCNLILNKPGKKIEIYFIKNDIRIPRKAGRKRNAFNKGVISDYLLFQHKNGTLIV